MNGIIYELLTVAQLVDKGFKSPDPPGDSIYSFKYSADVKKRVSVEARSYTASTRTHLEHFVCMYSFQMGIPQQVCTVQADSLSYAICLEHIFHTPKEVESADIVWSANGSLSIQWSGERMSGFNWAFESATSTIFLWRL